MEAMGSLSQYLLIYQLPMSILLTHSFCHLSRFAERTLVMVGPSDLCAPEQFEHKKTPKSSEAPESCKRYRLEIWCRNQRIRGFWGCEGQDPKSVFELHNQALKNRISYQQQNISHTYYPLTFLFTQLYIIQSKLGNYSIFIRDVSLAKTKQDSLPQQQMIGKIFFYQNFGGRRIFISIIQDDSDCVIILMNKRILKTADNKKPLKIIRQHKTKSKSTAVLHPNNNENSNLKLSNSSKKSRVNIKFSEIENRLQSEAKRVSFADLKESYVYEQQGGGSSILSEQLKYGRSQSNYKEIYSIKQTSIPQAIYQFVQMIKSRSILNTYMNSYIIQTNKFSKILQYVLHVYNTSDNIQHFSHLLKQEVKLHNFIRRNQYRRRSTLLHRNFKKLLSFSSNINAHVVYNNRQISLEDQLQEQQKELGRVRKEISELRNRKQEMTNEFNRKNNQCTQLSFQIEKLHYDFDQYVKREEFIKQIINNKEGVLAEIQLKTYSITNIFQQREMLQAKAVFEQSRVLEDSLYLFANYLKCHPHGQRSYQPSKKTNCVKRLLEKEARSLLMVDGDQREQLISPFIEKYNKQYKAIIDELQEVIADKTVLINKYSKLVEEWRQNYLQKRKILQTLRSGCFHEAIMNQRRDKLQFRIKQNELGVPSQDYFKTNQNLIKLFQMCHPLF